MTRSLASRAVCALLLASGCGGPTTMGEFGPVAPVPRRTVVWLDATGIDEATAGQLHRAGVDELVVPRGTINLSSGSPVLRLSSEPSVAGPIPVAIALGLEGIGDDIDRELAPAVWRVIAAEIGDATPAEIVLDLPQLASGLGEFLTRLSAEAGVPAVPVLTAQQLQTSQGVRAARAARTCVVPAFGTGHPSVRGVGELATLSLTEKLSPIASERVRVRIAVSLPPLCVPDIGVWGDDLGPLTEPDNASVSTSSVLDRTFVINRSLEWSGRQWQPGESVAVRWFDVARLHSALAEMNRLVLPELGGWDLVRLPPEGARLGMGREALIRYLGGEGPSPEVRVLTDQHDGRLTVSMINTSSFTSAVSAIGNWIEIAVRSGSLIAEGRGGFDRLVLGTRQNHEWQQKFLGAPNAVRFYETFVGPGEEILTGSIRISPKNADYEIRWQLVLSSGEVCSGTVAQ